jgi:hypothetical protein
MIVVIAGSRGIKDAALVAQAMREAADQKGIVPTLVLSGRAPGVDTLGGAGWPSSRVRSPVWGSRESVCAGRISRPLARSPNPRR